MHKLTGWYMFCTKADISWNTRSSSLLSRSGLVDHGVDHSLDPSFTIFQPCFWLRKRLECGTCTYDRVSFVWLTLAIATIPFSWVFFCHVEHCQLTTCSVWHEGLPDHFRPCQNTWAPHYAAARDWLKSKGVSALTDRSGVVYFQGSPFFQATKWHITLSLPSCRLKTTNIRNFKFQVFFFFFFFSFFFLSFFFIALNKWKDFHQNAQYWK